MTSDRPVIDYTHPTAINGGGNHHWDRPELTVDIRTDQRVPGLPQGDCIITSQYDAASNVVHLRIDQADPHVIIGVQLLEQIERSPADGVTLTLATAHSPDPGRRYEQATLRIQATNRTVTYRITSWLDWYLGCTAELIASEDVP